MRTCLIALMVGVPAGAASAQIFGTVTVTANGATGVTVAPGTPVSIGVRIAYDTQAIQIAGIQGRVRVDGDAGVGSNFVFNLGSGPLINTGMFQGGSRVGMDVASGPPLFFGINPLWAASPADMLSYDLTLTEPGEYTVKWELPVTAPNLRLYYTTTSASFQKGFTVTESATITVTPAPGALAAVGVAGLLGSRRRR